MTAAPQVDPAADAFTVEGLEKVYVTGEVEVRALRGVDLRVPIGAFVVMLGASALRRYAVAIFGSLVVTGIVSALMLVG